jgi:hypothetical protein
MAHEGYLGLGRIEAERQRAYRGLFQAAIFLCDLAEIRVGTHKAWALGDEHFREPFEALGH